MTDRTTAVAVMMVSLLAFGLFVSMPVSGQTERSAGKSNTDPGLNRLTSEFSAAFNGRNASRIASFYAADAVLLPPGGPMIKGRTGIEAFYREQFSRAGGAVFRFTPIESLVAGGHAFEAGTSAADGVVRGQPVSESGKYVTIYKRVSSEWKISYDIFNNDQ